MSSKDVIYHLLYQAMLDIRYAAYEERARQTHDFFNDY